MTTRPVIAVLGGARETARALEWLCRAGAGGFLIGDESLAVSLAEFKTGTLKDLPRADAILDASHAFDAASRNAAIAMAPDLPYARMGRAPWRPRARDNWTEVNSLQEAVAALPRAARVFAATGRGSLDALAAHDGPVFLRQLTRHDLPMPFAHGQFVFGTAPFSAADEVALFRRLEIDVVLARNIGGAGSFPKLAAARQLGLPVVLIRPPELPEGPSLASFDDIANWVASL